MTNLMNHCAIVSATINDQMEKLTNLNQSQIERIWFNNVREVIFNTVKRELETFDLNISIENNKIIRDFMFSQKLEEFIDFNAAYALLSNFNQYIRCIPNANFDVGDLVTIVDEGYVHRSGSIKSRISSGTRVLGFLTWGTFYRIEYVCHDDESDDDDDIELVTKQFPAYKVLKSNQDIVDSDGCDLSNMPKSVDELIKNLNLI